MMHKRGVRDVALAYPAAVPWMALFVRGVIDYADRHGGWNLTTSPPDLPISEEQAQTVADFRGWPGDGIITAIGSPAEACVAKRLGIPVVNLSGAVRSIDLPRVMVDHYSIGRMAAEHLLERGHRRLAYYGLKGLWFSEQRCLGFVRRAEQADVPCEVFESPNRPNRRTSWQQRIAPLVRWLQKLKPPIGLLAAQDYRARIVLDECLRLGLNVPCDVAILGVDNDATACEFCRPTLSSVSRNSWRLGYEAAALLDDLMAGKDPPAHDILIPPDGVVMRQSTDAVAVDDSHVAAAVRFMYDHIGEAFNVSEIMRHVSISRRQLESRFRNTLGCTPHDYLCRLRIERAKNLLAGPHRMKLRTIATACGFPNDERMRLVFQRLTGTTPFAYRRSCRTQGGELTASGDR